MRVSFGSLAQQGFPYTVCRPASRQASRQTVHSSAEKIASASFFDGLKRQHYAGVLKKCFHAGSYPLHLFCSFAWGGFCFTMRLYSVSTHIKKPAFLKWKAGDFDQTLDEFNSNPLPRRS
ncbi:MAG: hypothetical protein IKU70_09575, partial [Clostridia bacterium]|nr:hypothetical protein [Clostridia bacterium]